MGADLALINYNDDKITGNINNSTNIFIRLWSSESDTKIKSALINQKFIFLIKNKYLKLIIPMLSLVFIAIMPGVSVYLPRPNWIRWNLCELISPHKIVYYGDGFSLLCRTEKPFWLTKSQSNLFRIPANFIYSYSMEINNEERFNEFKIDNNKIIEYLQTVSYNCDYFNENSHLKETDRVLIVPTTTFYKTNRMELIQEIELYGKIINKIILEKNCTKFIIKFHPSTSIEIINSYYENFKNNKFLIKLPISTSLELAHLPIELFLRDLKVPYILMITSSGVAFAAKILSSREVVFCFGEKLLIKYINKDYLRSRLMQEKQMKKIFYEKL
jgi:hypothetical protein